jgi:chemotaxis protein CheX
MMKAELINPFVQASVDIISMMTQINLQKGTPRLVEDIKLESDIGIVIGLTGEIRGQVVIRMKIEDAKTVISKMMGGVEVTEIDSMGKSAISELGNMILGTSANNLYSLGYTIDITPPSILSGDGIIYSTVDQNIIEMPFESEEINVRVAISLVEDKE